MITEMNVPGTTTLFDPNSKSSEYLRPEYSRNGVLLIPQPSDDPNDPLNWSKLKKNIHFVTLFFYTTYMCACLSWTAPLLDVYSKSFRVTYDELTMAGGLQMLFFSVGCYVFPIIANKYGRRVVYLFTTLIGLLSSVAFLKQNFSGFMANNILAGIAAAPSDSLIEVSVGDIFFLDQHGTYIGLYSLALGIGSTMGALFGGLIGQDLSTWNWGNYILIILFGSLLIFQFIFMEESFYDRRELSNASEELRAEISDVPKKAEDEITIASVDDEKKKSKTTVSQKVFLRLKLLTIIDNKSTVIQQLIRPLKSFRYPSVVWVGLSYGLCNCWLSLINYSISQYYSAPPYSFSSKALGLLNLSGLVGAIIGAISMPLSDICQVYYSKKNGGISEPEFRLRLYWFPTVVITLGVFLWGFVPYFKLHWMGGACGLALVMYGISTTASLGLTYVMECYPKQMPQTMAAMLFMRNILGTIFTFVFQYWYDGMGVLNQTTMLGVICFFVNSLFLVFIFRGKRLRIYTKKWYLSSN